MNTPDTCSVRHCRKPASMGYVIDGEITGICSEHWMRFAAMPLTDAQAYLREHRAKKVEDRIDNHNPETP